jgi:protein O-GlcNAc transferase
MENFKEKPQDPRPAANATPVPMLAQAIAYHRAGLLSEADDLYRRILATWPDNFDCLHLLGVIASQRGQYEEAIFQFDRALRINPDVADAHGNRGNALTKLKRLEEALESFNNAIALDQTEAATFNNRGSVLKELKRFEEAVANYDRAIALKPDFVEALSNRGNALYQLERFNEALADHDCSIALKPDHAEAHFNRGIVLAALKRMDEALASYDHAIALKPDHVEAFHNKGVVLAEQQSYEEALASYDHAIALNPNNADAFCNRGAVLLALKRPQKAIESYDRASALNPDMDFLPGIRLHTKMQVCDWSDFDAECSRLLSAVRSGAAACFPFQLLACPARPQDQLVCAQVHADKYAAPTSPLWRGERYAHKRIRIAYLSADFRDHPLAHLTAAIFEHHDRSRFETFAISLGPDTQDSYRARLRAGFDRFVDARTMRDREVSQFLRQQEIDIAVDLSGVTEGSRPHILASKPTPLQVNFLGYAGTLGRSYCDYIVADRFVIPEHAQTYYTENVVYLPDSFMPSDNRRMIAERMPSRGEVGLPENGFIFCCFNGSFKITPDIFDVWMRLLLAIDGSVLWLPVPKVGTPENLLREANKRGVSADRLVFAPALARNADHLARLRLADVFLDTLYFNAHTTANDALWAGVPVITCAGETFASRVAGSLLRAVGLPELVTDSLADYETLALKLARDRELLEALKQRLALHRGTCALFNTARFTQGLEAAYTLMWERAERGEQPRSFAVEAIA